MPSVGGQGARHPETDGITFDFLGPTHVWGRSRNGKDMVRQVALLDLPPAAAVSEKERTIIALIDRQYLARPYYGSRRMAAWLATQGHRVNRKRVQRLMRMMALVAIYQRPSTSKPAAAHKIYRTCSAASRSSGS